MGTGRRNCVLAAVFTGMLCAAAGAQVSARPPRGFASNVIVPQARAMTLHPGAAVEITGVDVSVAILEQTSTTTMDISLQNPHGRRLEAELIVPVPDGAVVKGFTFQGSAKEPTAEVLPLAESKRIYESIVAKMRDPALVEFLGYNLVRTSVFPVEARGTQKVRLVYEALLGGDKGRVDYVLPRSESLEYEVPWRIKVQIKSKSPISTVYSPTHELQTKRVGKNHITTVTSERASTEPGPFRVSYVREQDGVSATVFAYPDSAVGGGYFLFLAGLPVEVPRGEDSPVKREVTLVFDRSGSMRGEKIAQVREAALQIIAGLDEGESFNIIAYNEHVDLLAEGPVVKNAATVDRAEEYLKRINANGGTNIYDALSEALGQKPVEGTLPIVLFLTDGLPTVGQTSEIAIRNLVIKGNTHGKRVFTFGVGVDVNVPLLERVANESRATSTFVLPKEDVEAKVGVVFRRLTGPVLSTPEIAFREKGGASMARVNETIPRELPDLFEGDQLVLVGQYQGDGPVEVTIEGDYFGRKRTFEFGFDPATATTRNSFVVRLWASRRIGILVDAIRQLGADRTTSVGAAARDPRVKELVDEVVRLSKRYGVLTEYTAFLAREGTDLSNAGEVFAMANSNFVNRGMNTRSGLAAANQAANANYQMSQKSLNNRNAYYDANMNRVSVTSVQQVSDRAFYNRGGRWMDSKAVAAAEPKASRVIDFGSDEWLKLAERLANEGRQGTMALRGEILLEVDGETVLVRNEVNR
jgi:Ca-activated chloride channel family protein